MILCMTTSCTASALTIKLIDSLNALMPRRRRHGVEHFLPSRQGDKNNRYLVGHAAYGQGLTQLERCEFEDAAASLEGLLELNRALQPGDACFIVIYRYLISNEMLFNVF